MHFTKIVKTSHYIRFHEKTFPWSRVIEIVLTSKNRRKRGDKVQIETDKYYILGQIRNHKLEIINAKWK